MTDIRRFIGDLPGEKEDVKVVLDLGAKWGYGNLISRLKKAWAADLAANGLSWSEAKRASGMICVWCNTEHATGKKVGNGNDGQET